MKYLIVISLIIAAVAAEIASVEIPDANNVDVTEEKSERVCVPQSQFRNYCNTCRCSDDGTTFTCTRMHCDKSIWNRDGTKIVRQDPKKACEPVRAYGPRFDCPPCTCTCTCS